MQQNNKFDVNSLIGFVLMGAILMYFMYTQEPVEQAVTDTEVKTEQVEEASNTENTEYQTPVNPIYKLDSNEVDERKKLKYGEFYYASTLASADPEATTVLENDFLRIEISNLGGQIKEAELKEYKTYSQENLYIVKDKNAGFNLNFSTVNNRVFSTSELFFEPYLIKGDDQTILSLKAKVSETEYLEYVYTLKKDDYMLDFSIKSVGLERVLDPTKDANIDWNLDVFRTEKSFKNENMYTSLDYEFEGGKTDYLSVGGTDSETEKNVTWVAFKQQFFSWVILNEAGFETATMTSETYDEFTDEVNHIQNSHTKSFTVNLPVKFDGASINQSYNMYIGPNKYNVLSSYDKNLDELIPLGWGIFGWINRFVVIPTFNFLEGFGWSYGLIIFVLTMMVKTVLAPITYKNFLSSARMRVIRPEIEEINEKHKNSDAMKKQQATMELYKKAGVNPMAGCLPALLQMPILFAMFRFFPSAIELRQESFLWAEDLSSYDSILSLPWYIPFYGDHISLFTLLMAGALMLYTMMSGAGMNQPTQPGMPNMKYMMYLMPVMMVVWFNSYASGLSYYYFLSNLISIIQIFIIKTYIIDEDKIHAQMQENKKKPVKKSKWGQKMNQMMQEAQKQQGKK